MFRFGISVEGGRHVPVSVALGTSHGRRDRPSIYRASFVHLYLVFLALELRLQREGRVVAIFPLTNSNHARTRHP